MQDETARSATAPALALASNQRSFVRYPLRSAAFRVRGPGGTYDIRLKDLSCGGTCGLMCEPLRVGDYVIIEFDQRHQIEAQICWVRRFLVGLQFTHPLTEAFVERLRERASSR
jgi:hypothetical protein